MKLYSLCNATEVLNWHFSLAYRVFTRSSKVPANVQQTSSWPDGTPPPISCGL